MLPIRMADPYESSAGLNTRPHGTHDDLAREMKSAYFERQLAWYSLQHNISLLIIIAYHEHEVNSVLQMYFLSAPWRLHGSKHLSHRLAFPQLLKHSFAGCFVTQSWNKKRTNHEPGE